MLRRAAARSLCCAALLLASVVEAQSTQPVSPRPAASRPARGKGPRKPALCRQVKTKADLPVPASRSFTLAAPELIRRHAFHGAKGAARRLQVAIAGRETPLVTPAGREGWAAPAARVADALAALPDPARALVKRVEINPVPNPEDGWWTRKYGMRVVAGMTADSEGVLRVYPRGLKQPRPVLVRNMMHEVGHIWSNRTYGSRRGPWTEWRKAIASDPAVPSLYATAAVTEDAAEATALYLSTVGTEEHERYRAKLPARFALLAKVLPHR
jgi:hypothetical protein